MTKQKILNISKATGKYNFKNEMDKFHSEINQELSNGYIIKLMSETTIEQLEYDKIAFSQTVVLELDTANKINY